MSGPARSALLKQRYTSVAALLVVVLIVCTPAAAKADNLIVPGQRIGPIKLGVTAQELYRVMGDPASSRTYADGGTLFSFTGGLDATVYQGRVVSIITGINGGRQYSTAEGLHPGDSELALQAKLGPPVRKRMDGTNGAEYWYGRGRTMKIYVDYIDCHCVRIITVYAPGG